MDHINVYTLDDECNPGNRLVTDLTWEAVADLFKLTDHEYLERYEPLEDPNYGKAHFLGEWEGKSDLFLAVNMEV